MPPPALTPGRPFITPAAATSALRASGLPRPGFGASRCKVEWGLSGYGRPVYRCHGGWAIRSPAGPLGVGLVLVESNTTRKTP